MIESASFSTISEHLDNDGVIVYPTETIMGIGSVFDSQIGFEKIFEIKQRDKGKPLIVLIPNTEWFVKFLLESKYSEKIIKISNEIWPAEVTLLVDVDATKVPSWLVAQDSSLAMRYSPHAGLNKFLEQYKKPITSTSANESGNPVIQNKKEAFKWIGANHSVMYADFGECNNNQASTILDLRVKTLGEKKSLILRRSENSDCFEKLANKIIYE